MNIIKLFESFNIEGRTKEEVDTYMTRKDAFKKMSKWGRNAALATLPLGMLSALPKVAFAQSNTDVVGILNYALTLEWLEFHFYNHALLGQDVTFTFTPEERAAITLIRDHEDAHVKLLTAAISGLNGNPVEFTYDQFDFSGKTLNFPTYTNKAVFFTLAQAFEDTGVRAYKGQAANIISNDGLLTTALQIHSVEARHAAHIRRMRIMGNYAVDPAEKAWVTMPDYDGIGSPNVAATAAVYAGEDNMTHGGLDVNTLTTVGAMGVREAFDEPLTRDAVLGIAGNFIR